MLIAAPRLPPGPLRWLASSYWEGSVRAVPGPIVIQEPLSCGVARATPRIKPSFSHPFLVRLRGEMPEGSARVRRCVRGRPTLQSLEQQFIKLPLEVGGSSRGKARDGRGVY